MRNLLFEILGRLISGVLEMKIIIHRFLQKEKIYVTKRRCTICSPNHFYWWMNTGHQNWKSPLVLARNILFIYET